MGYCKDPQYKDVKQVLRNFTFRPINRTTKIMEWDLVMDRDVDNTTEARIEMERWSGGRWIKMTFLPFIRDPCVMLQQYFSEPWVTLMKKIQVEDPYSCPWKAGNYSLRNLVYSDAYCAESLIPMVGKYRFHVIYRDIKTKTIYCCLEGITSQEIC
ncbi:uncharacterized protein LOC114324230 [Diabrotica virgifera virgifera]|uniref:Uncharacterized protein LOC114324230 n=1 Tax=Diabrotica virgifera virgifera TaxID=50390 RepID=A0A6P7EXD4_DIAVI|nr:uncharacterized protein LOC114324230 [Diabrotica virgifera virgifera]